MIAHLIAVALLAVPIPAVTAAPEDVPKWSVQPATATGLSGKSEFVFEGQPGQQFDEFVALSNLGDKQLSFTVYATDAYTGGDGSFALLPLLEQPKKLGTWLAMPPRSYAVGPGKRVIIPVKLVIPANATPGDHAAGIVASVTEEVTSPEGKKVNIDKRVGTRVYVRVAGAVQPSFAADNVQLRYGGGLFSGDMTVTYTLRNTGNIRVHGDSRIEVTGPFGIKLGASEKREVPDLLPGAEVTVTSKVSGVAPLGQLSAAVVVNPVSSEGLLPTASRSASMWVAPWAYAAILVLLIALIVALVWFVRRRRAVATTGADWPAP